MKGLDAASLAFILFGLGAVLLTNLSRDPRWRFAVMTVASVGFVVALSPHVMALLPLAGFLLLGYVAIVAVRRGLHHATTTAVVLLIGIYAWLKQYSFLPQSSFLAFPYFVLGLSYIFFRVLHLVIEAGLPGPEREIGPGHYLAYTLNFTTFVSGPIQRFGDFREQIDAPLERPDLDTIGNAVARIFVGFFKVNVAALVLSMAYQGAFAALTYSGSPSAKMIDAIELVVAYVLFLYCNFSGYMDIVIAIARLMGIVLPENFNRPFSATSLIDFWNRWHMTLSGWLKTYVYNPLLITLLRRFTHPLLEQAAGIFCAFLTFFLVGIWHGRTSEFLFFGVMQGGGMAINQLWQTTLIRKMGRKPYRAFAARPLYAMVARGLTFSWFAFSQIWLWASWAQVRDAYDGAGAGGWAAALVVLWMLATVVLALWEKAREMILSVAFQGAPLVWHRYVRTVFITILAATALVAVVVRSQPAPGIIYRSF